VTDLTKLSALARGWVITRNVQTQAEARSFLGLPDVEPIQAAVMERLQERMLSEMDRFSPESLINQWVSAFPQNAERMQEMFAKMFMAGLGQGRH
jgi:hypothetical protein